MMALQSFHLLTWWFCKFCENNYLPSLVPVCVCFAGFIRAAVSCWYICFVWTSLRLVKKHILYLKIPFFLYYMLCFVLFGINFFMNEMAKDNCVIYRLVIGGWKLSYDIKHIFTFLSNFLFVLLKHVTYTSCRFLCYSKWSIPFHWTF